MIYIFKIWLWGCKQLVKPPLDLFRFYGGIKATNKVVQAPLYLFKFDGGLQAANKALLPPPGFFRFDGGLQETNRVVPPPNFFRSDNCDQLENMPMHQLLDTIISLIVARWP